jgi:hypothetical protein
MWDPQHLTTLWASTARYGGSSIEVKKMKSSEEMNSKGLGMGLVWIEKLRVEDHLKPL